MEERLNFLYVGIDPHKHQHTAVALNLFHKKIDKAFTFDNRPSAFPQMIQQIKKIAVKGNFSSIIFGLEDTHNFGRNLTIFLKEQKYLVKEVNSKLSEAKRKSYATVKKSDAWDSECIAAVLIEEYDRLPVANPIDHYWAIKQLVSRRTSSMKGLAFSIRKLHSQLQHHYPTYRKFFSELDGKTSLGFFHRFPSPRHLEGVTLEELTHFLRKLSNYACSTKKAEQILTLVRTDGQFDSDFQDKRDFIVRSLVKEIRFHKREISESEDEIKPLMDQLGIRLDTLTGVELVTAASFIAEIGDVNRFASSNQLARFAGIAPIEVGSGGEVKHKKTSQGNRVLHELFFQLACRQLALSRRHKEPRNPIFLEYYNEKRSKGKTKGQAIVCIMRKLVNIVYKMMKNKTEYVRPVTQKENAV
ncbi:IS110 family transposase [Paenibacillus sp. Soil787]|uniref:IS110 family transposase n=1 Tax=Paenibacillus sp. Soil787 TaxID=1736411 RepID=UPI000702DCE1|nr:IS110 family transposase [Paenibacillus sp. Soil787]KRF27654.1 transposase [Paenibacillus sp. Soil787]